MATPDRPRARGSPFRTPIAAGAILILVPLTLALSPSGARSENLQVITVNAATGKPIAARVSLRVAGGEWRSPRDAAGRPFSYQGIPRLWSGGTIDVELPPGEVEVIASRPFAFLPATATLVIPPGGDIKATLDLKPVVDLRAMGWYGGDAHTHVVHGERHYTMDLRTVVPISRSEGLDWAAFGEVWTTEGAQPSPAERSAICREMSDDLFLAAWTQEYPKDHLGHMASFPLGVDRGFPETAGSNPYTTSLERREDFAHFEMIRSLQALGCLAVYTHPTREYGGTPESPANIARELPFDAVAAPWALEALDVLTDAPNNGADLRLWFFLLGRGHRLAACGFSDTCYDRKGERPGDTRTYVGIGDAPRTVKSIVAAIRRGRTFATTGPLALFTVDEKPAGTVFPADGTRRKGHVRAWNAVDYLDPRRPAFLTRMVLTRNGVPGREHELGEKAHEAEWSFDIEEKETSWYVIQVHGSSAHQFAVTSPFHFEGTDHEAPRPAEAVVRGKVTGDGKVIPEARVLAVEYGKDHLKVLGEVRTVGGEYRIRCPATCRIRVEAEGYEPRMKSIFIDNDPIYRDLFRPIRRDRLWDPDFYREIERRLEDVVLDFHLAAGD